MERGGGINRVKRYPLGDDDIRKLLGQDIHIMTYPQLEGKGSINECFDRKGRCILLFPNASPTMGHWCCMIKHPDHIEFFDPYGEAPEEQKEGLSQSRLEELQMSHPVLTDLLKGSGKPVYYNAHSFQKDRADVATCGRHCVVRLYYANAPLEAYKKSIDSSGLSPDDFVAALTYDKIKK